MPGGHGLKGHFGGRPKSAIGDLQWWYSTHTLCPLFRGTVFLRPGSGRFSDKQIYMAVRIRMKRIGTTNTPVYRIVVADSRSPRDGKFIEEIGTYQPLKKSDNVSLKLERAEYWLSKGAQPSDTVRSFIKKARKNTPVAA